MLHFTFDWTKRFVCFRLVLLCVLCIRIWSHICIEHCNRVLFKLCTTQMANVDLWKKKEKRRKSARNSWRKKNLPIYTYWNRRRKNRIKTSEMEANRYIRCGIENQRWILVKFDWWIVLELLQFPSIYFISFSRVFFFIRQLLFANSSTPYRRQRFPISFCILQPCK